MMFRDLAPGAIGIGGSLSEVLRLAKDADFEGVDLPIDEVAGIVDASSASDVKRLFADAGLQMGGWGLPVDFRKDEDTFARGLARLPALARVGEAVGCTRVPTWVLPFSDELPFAENFELHARRLRAVADVLGAHGCRLGLEFVGTATLREGHKHEFIHTLAGMLELADAIGTGNVGLLLDCWHWYTSRGVLDDLRQLTPDQIVYVHVNDAPQGVSVAEQVDNVRMLPGETGVIDIAGFLKCLSGIGYDGPVAAEPFNERVRQMPAAEAARATGEAMAKIWGMAGGSAESNAL